MRTIESTKDGLQVQEHPPSDKRQNSVCGEEPPVGAEDSYALQSHLNPPGSRGKCPGEMQAILKCCEYLVQGGRATQLLKEMLCLGGVNTKKRVGVRSAKGSSPIWEEQETGVGVRDFRGETHSAEKGK